MHDPDRSFRLATIAALIAITIVPSLTAVAPASVAVTGHSHGPMALLGDHHGPAIGGPEAQLNAETAKYFGRTNPYAGATKGIGCDEGSRPEKVQGKAPLADYESGRAAKGYFCN